MGSTCSSKRSRKHQTTGSRNNQIQGASTSDIIQQVYNQQKNAQESGPDNQYNTQSHPEYKQSLDQQNTIQNREQRQLLENQQSIQENKEQKQSLEDQQSIQLNKEQKQLLENQQSIQENKEQKQSLEDQQSIQQNKEQKQLLENQQSIQENQEQKQPFDKQQSKDSLEQKQSLLTSNSIIPISSENNQSQNDLSMSSIQQISVSRSSFISTDRCCYCHQFIHDEYLHLACNHVIHSQCFSKLLRDQITLQKSIFSCICNTKISPTLVNEKYILNDLFNRQLMIIKGTNNYQSCPNRVCDYFYKPNKEDNEFLCPYCK